MIEASTAHFWIFFIFLFGYALIVFEYQIKINKTASALLMAVLVWALLFFAQGRNLIEDRISFGEKFNSISQIVFFLLGAMTLVELIDSHKGFKVITNLIQTSSKKKMLWIFGITTFFLSAILDNLTTTIIMVSLLRKLVIDRKERAVLGSMVVIAANAGGAWTPIGDVTTTMLWINGNLSTLQVMRSLFIPSFLSLLAALCILGSWLKGHYPRLVEKANEEKKEPGSRLVFFSGLGGLIFVPIFKAMTGLPPFMGVLIAVAILWLITDLLHSGHETRQHLRIPHVLTRIDTSGVLFFLGILLCVSALDVAGLLEELAFWLNQHVSNLSVIAALIGLFSAIIDNVPLVAAGMGMYDLQSYPMDSFLWIMLAYCAGTGGSILIIGSAAGVALMGMEKINFIWYLRKMSWVALVSYGVGIGAYLLQRAVLGF